MIVTKTIFFNSNNKKGLLQHIVSKGMQKYVILNASSLESHDFASLDSIYTEGTSKYFLSRIKKANLSNYFLIEFVDRFVYPTGYVISSHSAGYLKSWMLEGSLDSKSWDLLHSIYESNDYATTYRWYRISKKGQYRFFKITQTGESTGTEDYQKYSLRISYLDFFGYMSNGQHCTNNPNIHRNMHLYLMILLLMTAK